MIDYERGGDITVMAELLTDVVLHDRFDAKGPTAAQLLGSSVCRAICETVSQGRSKELKPHLILPSPGTIIDPPNERRVERKSEKMKEVLDG